MPKKNKSDVGASPATKPKKSSKPKKAIFSRNKADFKDDAAAFRDIISENPPHEEGEFDYIDQHTEKQFRWQQVRVAAPVELKPVPSDVSGSPALTDESAQRLVHAAHEAAEMSVEIMMDNIAHDLRESINSDIKSISEHAKKAAKALGEATVARVKGDIDDAAYRAIMESYWRANRSRIARLADRTASKTLLGTIKAMMQLLVGAIGGTGSLVALKVE